MIQNFSFFLNGEKKQESCGAEMLCSPYELIVYVSQFFPLRKGDLLFTGTPKGVGPLKKGDRGEIFFQNEKYFQINWI